MRRLAIIVFLLLIIALAIVRLRYGGTEPFNGPFSQAATSLYTPQVLLQYPEPIGGLAINADGRLFFSVHPESRPQGNKILEWIDGAAEPYPDGASQIELFDSVLGIAVDPFNRLWTLDSGEHGLASPRLLAFDLETNRLQQEFTFPVSVAPAGSYLHSLVVTSDGKKIIIADSSILGRSPALIVYDIEQRRAQRILEAHESLTAKPILINSQGKNLSYFGGLFDLQAGVNALAIDCQQEWLYFAALSHDRLYRLPLKQLSQLENESSLVAEIEIVSAKPPSGGIAIDGNGTVYLSEIQHGAISTVTNGSTPKLLLQSDDIRWADSITFDPAGNLYIAESALPDQLFQTKAHMQEQAPYSIFRISLPNIRSCSSLDIPD